MRTYRLALIGFGNVGQGLATILRDYGAHIAGQHGADFRIVAVNAARKEADLKHLQIGIGNRCQIVTMPDEALLALQGPAAALVLGRLAKDVGALRFMDSAAITIAGVPCQVSRSNPLAPGHAAMKAPATLVVAGSATSASSSIPMPMPPLPKAQRGSDARMMPGGMAWMSG